MNKATNSEFKSELVVFYHNLLSNANHTHYVPDIFDSLYWDSLNKPLNPAGMRFFFLVIINTHKQQIAAVMGK